MEFRLYSKVKLVTDKYKSNDTPVGTIGIILDSYDTGDYEVQFLDNEGNPTTNFFAVNKSDIEKIED